MPRSHLTPYAKALRKRMTRHEVTLWSILRRWEGYKFRRQAVIGPYIVDFACFHPKVVIELDGSQHNTDEARIRDAKRDALLEKGGFAALRFWNCDVDRNIEGVMERIAHTLHWKDRGI